MLFNRRIGVFVTGGIASYKVAELVRQLIKKGAQVKVAMTQSAQQFITPLTFQTLTKAAVLIDTFDEHTPQEVQHIAMADWCELAIVVPATANIVAKMAMGMADDVVSTTLMAVHCPRLIVPAMNENMYYNLATQRNLSLLQQYGYMVMEPDTGFLAEGYEGKGRLPELTRIVAQAEVLLAQSHLPQILDNLRIVVTAGGTKERIDPVRYITNDSSGKMGYALAQAAVWLGAKEVHLLSTTKQLDTPQGVNVYYVQTAQELFEAVNKYFEQCDAVVMAAAVSDYRVAQSFDQKMKKQPNQTEMTLQLVENPDILSYLGHHKTTQKVIGFAAETQHVIEYATSKLHKKQADWIVANDVSQSEIGFNADTNQVTLLSHDGKEHVLPKMSKLDTAIAIWQTIYRGE